MPARELPPNPNLEQLKNQSRELLRAFRSEDPQAMETLREFIPRLKDEPDLPSVSIRLADAQSALARQYGFESWRKLRQHIEAPSSPDLSGDLIKAIQNTDLDRVTVLLDQDPSLIDVENDAGLSLFHTAAMYGYSRRTEENKPIVDLLLERGLEPDIFACAYLRRHEDGQQLIASDPASVHETSDRGLTALHFSAEIGDLAFTRLLVESGAAIDLLDARGETPLLKALHAGPWKPEPANDVVQYLLTQGARVSDHVAAAMGDLDRLRAAFGDSPDRIDEPDDQGCSPLFYAAKNNRPAAVAYLLQQGADVNASTLNGETAVSTATLHTLSQECDLDMLQGLVDAGAEYAIRTAIALNDRGRVDALLDEDPKLANDRTDHGPIDYAIHIWKPDIIKLLIQRGCELTEEEIGHVERIAAMKGVTVESILNA